MRTEKISIYTIDDHPDKEVCFEWMRNNWHDLGDHVLQEMVDSLKALANAVNGTLDYSININQCRGEHVSIKDYDKELLHDLHDKRDDYPLTGVCYDYDVIEALHDDELESRVLSTMHKEGDYIYSDEGLLEMCQANEYEFLLNGEGA